MLRVVIAVALAAALLGISMPAVETARIDHAQARMEAELDRLATAADRLAEQNDPTPTGIPGARRTVTLHLPGSSLGTASVDYIAIEGSVAGSNASRRGSVTWRVAGGTETSRTLRVPLVAAGEEFRLESGGRQRVILELERQDGQPVVVARRSDFKWDARASPGHDDAGRTPPGPVPGWIR